MDPLTYIELDFLCHVRSHDIRERGIKALDILEQTFFRIRGFLRLIQLDSREILTMIEKSENKGKNYIKFSENRYPALAAELETRVNIFLWNMVDKESTTKVNPHGV